MNTIIAKNFGPWANRALESVSQSAQDQARLAAEVINAYRERFGQAGINELVAQHGTDESKLIPAMKEALKQ